MPPRVQVGADPLPAPGGAGTPMIRFWVRDNGPGLAPEEQARLFPSSSDSAMATVPEEGEGRPSRWNTLRALRVLDWYSAHV